MSKSGTTYFCSAGHLLENNPHACFGKYDSMEGDYPPCPYCKSMKVIVELGWGDDDYAPHDVPCEPIRQGDVERTDHKGNKYFQLINVYDVSKRTKPNTENDFNNSVTLNELKETLSGANRLPLVLEVNGVQKECMNFQLRVGRLILTDKPVGEN